MASDSKAKILREGERFVQQGKISLAINEYLKIIKIDPEDVLTLNTIGDLYLRQGRMSEANRLFLQVADAYTRNNFLLKAIAVYRKILSSDPHNLEVNLLLASLYARQAMNVDARNQYMFVANLCTQEGKTQESLQAYEKVVEIDPLNSPIQLKLAETYLSQGLNDKAFPYFLGAARAQVKAGDYQATITTLRRALELNPDSSEALKCLLETALQSGNIVETLGQVRESLSRVPDEPAMNELLGRAYLAAGELEEACRYCKTLADADETRYEQFFPLSQAFLEAGDPDGSIRCLDHIVPRLISHRHTDKLTEAYNLILTRHPSHVGTLKKFAEVYSATNDEMRHISMLERIAQHYQDTGHHAEALEPLEKILLINPDSEKHRKDHRASFEAAFPGKTYVLPRAVLENADQDSPRHKDAAAVRISAAAAGEESTNSTLIEIDLLLNYGMKEKALQLLRTLEASTPLDKTMRQRLVSIYRQTDEPRLAAEQCVLLSAIHQKAGDQEAARKSLTEAENLAPEWAKGLDVTAFARQHGISLESPAAEALAKGPGGGLEVDLSGDLSEMFFKDAHTATDYGLKDGLAAGTHEPAIDDFSQDIAAAPAPESIEEQLQEVDFYIRLGFHDEARAKLDEIAAAMPGNPELAARYSLLGLEPSWIAAPAPIPLAPPEPPVPIHEPDAPEPEPANLETLLREDGPAQFDAPLPESAPVAEFSMYGQGMTQEGVEPPADQYGENRWFYHDEQPREELPEEEPEHAAIPVPEPEVAVPAVREAAAEPPPNSMFADLIEEVNSLTDQEIAQEDFETHFSLGTAYREMGLTEEAIKEFQSAVRTLNSAKSPRETIQCCGMLSTCFLEKGMPRSAIRWCQTALGMKEISSHETMALRYDMGVAHAAAGESDRALECFGQVFGIDPSYRDVARRIDDLKSGLERHAP